jgi:hypothetical protein
MRMKTCIASFVLASSFIFNAVGVTRYVNVDNATPTSPYTDWVTAATNIQDAIDAADPGDLILVTNGVYQTGTRISTEQGTNYPTTNRVAVTKPTTVQSVNGPSVTIIRGSYSGTFPGFSDAVRCVYLTNGTILSGFTLTNGASGYGGGIYCESTNAVVTNCMLVGNICGAPLNGGGGGAHSGTLNNCTLTGNSSYQDGGGADSCMLNNCLLTGNSTLRSGGGAYNSVLNNCVLQGNSATAYYYLSFIWGSGGGANGGTLIDCTLTGNSAAYGGGVSGGTLINCTLTGNAAYSDVYSKGGGYGGGAYFGTLINCTLTGNSAISYPPPPPLIFRSGGYGGGAYSGTLKNSIIYFNGANLGDVNYSGGSLDYCCTIPMPSSGSGNITSGPLFVNQAGGNLRLQSNSPCINSGNNLYVSSATDLDGNPRIVGGTVDIGAYEFQSPTSVLSYVWAQQFGLPTDGSADYADTDGDHLNNWQEWIAGTIPTNAASVLIMSAPSKAVSGVTITWRSVTNRTYFLQRATNLSAQPAFTSIQSNIVGQAGTTTYADLSVTNGGPYFYRVGVQ